MTVKIRHKHKLPYCTWEIKQSVQNYIKMNEYLLAEPEIVSKVIISNSKLFDNFIKPFELNQASQSICVSQILPNGLEFN